jgi:hypothetical protein
MHKSSYFNSCTAIFCSNDDFALFSCSKFLRSSEASNPTSCAKSSASPMVNLGFCPCSPSSSKATERQTVISKAQLDLGLNQSLCSWLQCSNIEQVTLFVNFFCDTQRRMRRYSVEVTHGQAEVLHTYEKGLKKSLQICAM